MCSLQVFIFQGLYLMCLEMMGRGNVFTVSVHFSGVFAKCVYR